MVVLQSLWCAVEHMLVYPWMVEKLNIPIPYMGRHGSRDHVFCYIGMVRLEDHAGLHDWCFILWGGRRRSLARLGVL